MRSILKEASVALFFLGVPLVGWSQSTPNPGTQSNPQTPSSPNPATVPNPTAFPPATPNSPNPPFNLGAPAAPSRPNVSANPSSSTFPSPLPATARERLPGWFTAPGIREQLALNPQQFNLIEQAYGTMQLQLETSAVTAGSGANPDPAQVFSLAVDKAIIDPLKRTRYNQLRWQYLGPEALMDPEVQTKLGLTAEQKLLFSNVVRDWRTDLATLRNLYLKEPGLASRQFLKIRIKYQNEIVTLLDEPQRLAWQQLLGERFEYDASLYLAPGGGTIPLPTGEGGGSESVRAARERSAESRTPAASTSGLRPDPRDNMGRNSGLSPRPSSGSAQGAPPTGEGGEGLENKNKPPSNPGALAPLVP